MKLVLLSLITMCVASIVYVSESDGAGAGEYKPDANAPRSQVPARYKWDTSALFKSDGEWEAAYNKAKKDLSDLLAIKDKVGDATALKNFMEKYEAVSQLLGKVALYPNLKNTEDENVSKYEKMHLRSSALMKSFQPTIYLEAIIRMDDKKAEALLSDKSLMLYKASIEDIRRRRSRILTPEAERVMALMEDNIFAGIDLNELASDSENVFKATMRDLTLPEIKDEDGKDVQLTISNYPKYRASKNRDVRRGAVEALFGSLRKYQDILAAALGGEARRSTQLSRARNYDSSVDAYLDRDRLTPAVIDGLVSAVHRNIGVLHKYISLRKKILGLRDIHIYDLYTPLAPSVETHIPYEKGVADIVEALKPLGEKYTSTLSKALSFGSGWTDVYPNKGKESGAFCASTWGIHPFIKLNYMDDIDSVSAIAHEYGHGMHSVFNQKAQTSLTAGYAMVLAETASTFNEVMLNRYLTDKYRNDDNLRLYLLGEMLNQIRTTVFRQAMFQEFERKVHEFARTGTPITADLLNKTYKDLIGFYYGPDFTIDKEDEVEWSYIPHLYYKYYVYSYATGLASGIALNDLIAKEGDKARDRYLDMLRASVTEPPLEVLKKAGVDLTKPDVINAAAKEMDRIMYEIEKITIKKP